MSPSKCQGVETNWTKLKTVFVKKNNLEFISKEKITYFKN